MSEKALLCEVSDHVATIVLNRPAKKNSMSPELVELLQTKLVELEHSNAARAVIIRGAGDEAFCAGYDISSLPVADRSKKSIELRKTKHLQGKYF